MEPQIVKNPQLVVKRCNLNGTSFVHCLICSTAPKNAEEQRREDLQRIDLDNSLVSLAEIKLSDNLSKHIGIDRVRMCSTKLRSF